MLNILNEEYSLTYERAKEEYELDIEVDDAEEDLTAEAFKKYLETPDADGNLPLDGLATSIKYSYNLDLNIFTKDKDGNVVSLDAVVLSPQHDETVSDNQEQLKEDIF